MSSALKKGILIGLALYGLGAVLTVIVHLIFGWESPHAPPVSAIPVFFTLVIGAIRLFITANNVFMKNSATAKGELAIHAFVALLLVLLILWMKYQ
ncbi:MAG TPA: hypothetical protein VIU12_05650 [Chryseolinea sp.]